MKSTIKETGMRRATLLLALTAFFATSYAYASAPTLVPIQGVLTDDSDKPVAGVKSLKFSLYTTEIGDSPVWTETQTITVIDGFFSAYLGDDTALDLILFKNNANLWLGIQVDSGAELVPRTYLGTGPYTAFAEYCGNVPSHTHPYSEITGSVPDSAITSVAASKITGVLQIANGGTGSSTKNFADLTSDQTVAGAKTFSSTINGSVSGFASGFTGALSGDVTGGMTSTYVEKIRGKNVSTTAPVANQFMRYNGTDWAPGAVNLLTDTTGILPVSAGGTGSAILNFVDLTTNQSVGGVKTFTSAPAWSGTASGKANDSDKLNGQQGSYYQRRVAATCGAGSSIKQINADGSVVCESGGAFTGGGFAVTAIDTAGDVGRHTAATVGTDGLGLISYQDFTNGDLKVAHCQNTTCTSADISTLDTTDTQGLYTSITIGADGLGLISYMYANSGHLKVAHCNDVKCTSATISTLDTTSVVGYHTSVTIGSDGLGLISYYDYYGGDLKVAHCSNTNCTSATISTIDSTNDAGDFSSITIGADGLGLISYYYVTFGDLRVAHCSNINCTSATITAFDTESDSGRYTSIALGADGLGLISYYEYGDKDLKVLHCSNTNCTAATISTLDTAGDVGAYTSISIGTDGLGLISYYDTTNANLKIAHCSNTACSSATYSVLDSTGDVGTFNSLTIGADSLGLVSYYDATNGDLKVAHCSNAFCIPNWRRR
jgi:preprotein translocase subunit Sec61beta